MTSTASPQPIPTFVSYSREDGAHCEILRRHLAGLVNEGFIELFYDRDIRPGTNWEEKLFGQLRNAKIILLLVTKNFTSSEFCYKKELPIALEMHSERRAIVIPVLVAQTDWTFLKFKEIQSVPHAPITAGDWRTEDEAWTVVAKEVREQATLLRTSRPVSEMLDGWDEVRSSTRLLRHDQRPLRRAAARAEFDRITDFWNSIYAQPKGTPMVASVSGTFSRYAPMMVGPPRAKRSLHREFRTALQRNTEFGQLKLSTINACLSISAGQMVQLAPVELGEKHYFGLYNSIVRNSIPVIIDAEYYKREVMPILDRHSYEATVTGRVVQLDNSQLQRYADRHGLERFISPMVIDDLVRNAAALEVGGDDTGIVLHGPPRYLDGDIWLAVESEGIERFLTVFVDIADPSDRNDGLAQLENELNRLPSPRIIARWDDEECEFRQFLQRSLYFGLGDSAEGGEPSGAD